jgi:LmbE family N-acetylglucosaminyl deacetylase
MGHPSRLLLFAPHPDDICISAGALSILACEAGIETQMILVTDGSESKIPEHVLRQYGWNDDWSPKRTRDLRGEIRLAEAKEEARHLGLKSSSVQLLRHQNWHTYHQTPDSAMNPDLSIQDVSKYSPSPLDAEAVREIVEVIQASRSMPLSLVFPDPNDKLTMHRTVSGLVSLALSQVLSSSTISCSLLLYRCLSSFPRNYFGTRLFLEFEQKTVERKLRAIQAHVSMKERRRLYGGYSSTSSEFYDEIVLKWNKEIANSHFLSNSYAEEYGLVENPSEYVLQQIQRIALGK